MSSSVHETLTRRYTIALDALSEIAREYYTLGRLDDAQHLLRASLHLLESGEAEPQSRLKLLLLYGKVLLTEHMLTRQDTELLFSTLLEARQIAEATHDQQGEADVLSLLGQAHLFTVALASLQQTGSPESPQSQGKYDEAFAYQQQALHLRETLSDSRGISESHFFVGNVYEFWQQHDLAQEHFTTALQIAEQSGHRFEQTEPTRHLAFQALRKGDMDQALTLALQALALREAVNFRPFLPLDHLLLRNIYLAKADTERAKFHTQQASAIASEMGYPTLVSSLIGVRYAQPSQQEEV